MTDRLRTLLLAMALAGLAGGVVVLAFAGSWRWPWGQTADGIARPLWLLRAHEAEAEAYLAQLDREELLRAFLIADTVGFGGELSGSRFARVRETGAVPPLRVLRGHTLDRPRPAAPLAQAPIGHDLASALTSAGEDAIALEAEAYVREVLAAGAPVVLNSPMEWGAGMSGDLLDLDDSRLRRLVRWIDPRRKARTPLARAAARPGTLAENFAETVRVGGVHVATADTTARPGSVQWRGRLPGERSDSVFQVSSSARDWAIAEAIYAADPAATLDSLRAESALTAYVLRRRLLPMTTFRIATRRMGFELLDELLGGAADSLHAPYPPKRERFAEAGVRSALEPRNTPAFAEAGDTLAFRLRTRRGSATDLSVDSAALPWSVSLDTVLVVNASGLRNSQLRGGLGVYGPARWVSDKRGGIDSLVDGASRTIFLVGPGAAHERMSSWVSRRAASDTADVAVVVVGAPAVLKAYRTAPALLYQPSADLIDWRNLYAGLFGGHEITGVLPAGATERQSPGPSLARARTRLAPLDPYTTDIDVVQLTDIDVVMREAVDAGAFPGGQVSVVYDGQVVYDKGFGTLAPGERGVLPTDLYDLASLTKVASTTLAVMRLYERDSIDLDAPLRRYIDGLPASTGGLRVRQLLQHRSGLPPSLPIYAQLKQTRRAYHRVDCKTKYCSQASSAFSVPVAHRVFYRGADRNAFYAAAKREQPKDRYRYSDLNFFLLQQVVERVTGQPLDAYVREQFYEPLGIALTYNPLDRYGRRETLLRTAPTEYDYKWRRQRLRGYVHDEAAALQGGIGGHAGVFGSARDVAVLFAMLGDGGHYGGVRYFTPETIATFTETDDGVRRGLGFAKAPRPDEPDDGPRPVFGHTGFTGTSVWTDPEAGITVAFTSNRIYRGRANWKLQKMKVREQVSRIVYDALADDPRDGDDGKASAKTQAPAL